MRRDRFRDQVLSEGLDGTATVRRVAWYEEGNSTGDVFPELYWDLEVQGGGAWDASGARAARERSSC